VKRSQATKTRNERRDDKKNITIHNSATITSHRIAPHCIRSNQTHQTRSNHCLLSRHHYYATLIHQFASHSSTNLNHGPSHILNGPIPLHTSFFCNRIWTSTSISTPKLMLLLHSGSASTALCLLYPCYMHHVLSSCIPHWHRQTCGSVYSTLFSRTEISVHAMQYIMRYGKPP